MAIAFRCDVCRKLVEGNPQGIIGYDWIGFGQHLKFEVCVECYKSAKKHWDEWFSHNKVEKPYSQIECHDSEDSCEDGKKENSYIKHSKSGARVCKGESRYHGTALRIKSGG